MRNRANGELIELKDCKERAILTFVSLALGGDCKLRSIVRIDLLRIISPPDLDRPGHRKDHPQRDDSGD